jgi:two-component system sensor histidine kinase BarA
MRSKPDTPPRGRILAVDDSPVVRILVTASLEALGYVVEAVDSGFAAIEASKHESFDAVVLDVDMPGMDGLAVGRALRTTDSSTLVCMAIFDVQVFGSLRSGFDAYDLFVSKSCSPRSLGESVDLMIQGHRRKATAPA